MKRNDVRLQARAAHPISQTPLQLSPQPPRPDHAWLVPTLIAGVVLLAGLAYALVDLGRDRQRLAVHAGDLSRQLATLSAPNCDAQHPALAQVRDLVAAGETETAATVAQMALSTDRSLCASARQPLAALWYQARMDGLLGQGREALENSGSELVSVWRSIESTADEFALPQEDRWPAMTVSERAYQAGAWPLSDAAFRQAWSTRQLAQIPVGFRYAVLRNWGHHLAQGNARDQPRAASLLATACLIAQVYELADTQAQDELAAFFATRDCQGAGPDMSDPALADRKLAGATMRNNNAAADAIAGIATVAVIAAIAAVVILAARTLTEVIRINVERGGSGSPIARPIRQALIAFVGALVVSAVLMMSAATTGLGAALAAWSFLAYVIYIEVLDSRLVREEQAALPDLADLASYLTSAAPTKGGATAPSGMAT